MSFANFLRRYHLAPPEKLDGYSASDFAGMSGEERARAQAMLLERGLCGDTIDLDGLQYVGDRQAAAALEAAGQRAAELGPRFDIQRLEILFVLTADERHLLKLLSWTDQQGRQAAGLAAEALGRHRLPADLAAPIAARLADGRHEDIVRQLVEAWLATRGELVGRDMAAFGRRLPLIRAISAARPGARMALLVGAA